MIRLLIISLLLWGCGKEKHPDNPLASRKVEFQITYRFILDGAKHFRVQALLPASVPGRQFVEGLQYSLTPRIEVTAQGDSLGYFRYFKPKDTVTLRIQGRATLFMDTSISAYSDSEKEQFLHLQAQAAEAFEYQLQERDLDLGEALAKGRGDCSEYAAYAVRLCKQAGYDARELAGIHSRKGMDAFHSWAECRKPGFPWVVLDPTWADERGQIMDSLEKAGLQAIRELRPTTWKLQIGRDPRLDNGFRLVSWRVDKGHVAFTSTAWMRE